MIRTNISKDVASAVSSARGSRGWRARITLGCALVAAAAVTVVGVPGAADAATATTVQLSFSSDKISVGTRPDLTFLSQDVPSGSILYLQESLRSSGHWTSMAKTTNTQGTTNIAALSQGVYEFRIIVADNGTQLAVSAPATLTVISAGGTPTPAAIATAAPSGSGIPWMKIIVEPVWNAIVRIVIDWILSLF
jgi:hypothetical protein